ncbi:MAG: hypothetical protein WCV67_08985 [Victivallaceae bacterium]|jgi:hypothetical protein
MHCKKIEDEGEDEGDLASGHDCVNLLNGNKPSVQIYFHQGDDSGFTAVLDEG